MPDETNTTVDPVSAGVPTLPTVAAPDAPVASNATGVSDTSVPGNNPGDASAMNAEAANTPVADSPVVEPTMLTTDAAASAVNTEIPAEVMRRIGESQNVLVALSSDPSVDEMAAAIGLTLFLDKIGKRATAIYSGQTPNALEFLKPEETFEDSADTLQDFVIALNKEKADHLRYKLDGEYVKIYITPYKSKIVEEDLDFSYGDYNVDLVLALDVANGVDLDAALREHGRIMHDAVIINITTGNPGKLGEIEWSDKTASSVSEMIARLLYGINGKVKIEKEEATAFLTGIVAATNRFSNAGTTPETMQIASKLMESGANQQLVSSNITPDVENELANMSNFELKETKSKTSDDPTKLDIEHDGEKDVEESKVADTNVEEKDSSLLEDLKEAEASLATAGSETTPEKTNEPLKINNTVETEPLSEVAEEVKQEVATEAPEESESLETPAESLTVSAENTSGTTSEEGTSSGSVATAETTPETTPETTSETTSETTPETSKEETASEEGSFSDSVGTPGEGFISDKPEKVIQPSAEVMNNLVNESEADKYGQMLEDALASVGDPTAAPVMSDTTNTAPAAPTVSAGASTVASVDNPAVAAAPPVAANPEINGVPQINYMPMPGDEVLPPPPTPPIDMDMPTNEAVSDTPATPAVDAVPVTATASVDAIEPAANESLDAAKPVDAQPVEQNQIATDPGAFKIPGI